LTLVTEDVHAEVLKCSDLKDSQAAMKPSEIFSSRNSRPVSSASAMQCPIENL